MARLLERNGRSWSFICGGTIISENTILTAAHCIRENARNLAVVVGDRSLYLTETSEQFHRISQITRHENYNEVTNVHDFAILRLQGLALISLIFL